MKPTTHVLAAAALWALGLQAHAAPALASTSDASAWQVAVNLTGTDGQQASFPVTGFTTATAVSGRTTDGVGWIANNASGTNAASVGHWTFFVFRQTFDLTGYDAGSASLSFQWAADDSGEGFADRGTWRPKYRLNGGTLVNGDWPTGSTYGFGNTTTLNSGFTAGLNTLDFYVEGNGVTDGFAFKPLSFSAQVSPVPEPETYALMLGGLALLSWQTRRQRRGNAA